MKTILISGGKGNLATEILNVNKEHNIFAISKSKLNVYDINQLDKVVKKIKPDIIVKGGDYTSEDVIGNDLAEVIIFGYIDGYSTTKIIQDLGNR